MHALPQALLSSLGALSPEDLAKLPAKARTELALALEGHEQAVALRSFRAFCESPHFCNLTLSPLMAAIMDASEGRPVTSVDDVAAVRHFGCARAKLPRVARRLVAVRAGGRAGKTSRLLATKALHAALTVPVPTLGRGERPVSLLMAPDLKLGHQILGFVKGYIEGSPALSALAANETADEVELRRPDGNPVVIRVRAASRGGRGARGFVLVFFGMDEASFFRDEASGVVNDTEVYRAAAQRLVPGAQGWAVSTPWVQGMGLLEDTLAVDFGVHLNALCAVAPTRALNPTWDPDGTIERALRESDPDNASREIDAIPLTSGSNVFFDKATLDHAVDDVRPMALPADAHGAYSAGGDFGFRRNSSALAVVKRDGDRFALAAIEELSPSPGAPLAPSAVCDAFAAVLLRYHCTGTACDSHERDQVRDELARHGLSAYEAPEGQAGKAEMFTLTRRLLREGRLSLPKHPRLLSQLRGVTSKPAAGGGLSISQPHTADGAHGDLVSALVAAVWAAEHRAGRDLSLPTLPGRGGRGPRPRM